MPRKPKTEKIDAKELAKKLLIDKTHGAAKAGAKELEKADKFSVGYKKFLDLSKTERETVTYAVEAAEAAGFVPFEPGGRPSVPGWPVPAPGWGR